MPAESSPADFLEWATGNTVPVDVESSAELCADLRALDEMIGDATLVALTEAVHGGAEPLEVRNKLFRYLVEKKGFTTIAIESGIVESHGVYDYVQSGVGDMPSVVATGITWTFDRFRQNHALIRWLRDYNADPRRARKLRFYGFDVSGSPGNPDANVGMDSALNHALHYLDQVERAASTTFRTRLAALLPHVRFDFHRPPERPGYDCLSPAERDALTAAIADVIALYERRECEYTEQTSSEAYEWGYRAAVGARQVDTWLRQVPIGWKSVSGSLEFPSEDTRFFATACDVRDRAQADNLEWIVQREGPLGKLLIYASRYHLSTSPIRTPWSLPERPEQVVAGTYLRRRYAGQLLTIGNIVGNGGSFDYLDEQRLLEPAASDSIDGIGRELGSAAFLLDLRRAPAPVKQWLDVPRPIGPADHSISVACGQAFDLLLYLDHVTPASN